MRRSLLMLVVVLLCPACAPRTYIRSAIGEAPVAAVNLSRWDYVRTSRVLTLRWARIGPPLWVRRADDGGLEVIGVLIEGGSYAQNPDFGPLYRPGRTHLVAVSLAMDGSIRRPTPALRRDMDEVVRTLRRLVID